MIFHENRLPADDSHEMSWNSMPYLLILKKRQNLKLSSAANYRWRFMLKFKTTVLITGGCTVSVLVGLRVSNLVKYIFIIKIQQ